MRLKLTNVENYEFNKVYNSIRYIAEMLNDYHQPKVLFEGGFKRTFGFDDSIEYPLSIPKHSEEYCKFIQEQHTDLFKRINEYVIEQELSIEDILKKEYDGFQEYGMYIEAYEIFKTITLEDLENGKYNYTDIEEVKAKNYEIFVKACEALDIAPSLPNVEMIPTKYQYQTQFDYMDNVVSNYNFII